MKNRLICDWHIWLFLFLFQQVFNTCFSCQSLSQVVEFKWPCCQRAYSQVREIDLEQLITEVEAVIGAVKGKWGVLRAYKGSMSWHERGSDSGAEVHRDGEEVTEVCTGRRGGCVLSRGQAPLPMGLARQEDWSGLKIPLLQGVFPA